MTSAFRTTLVTHANQYVGPGAVASLLAAGHRVIAHDSAFTDNESRQAYTAGNPKLFALEAQDAGAIVAELQYMGVMLDAAVLNAVHPIIPAPIGKVHEADLISTFLDVVLFPIALAQGLMPLMERSGCGSFVFVTSARDKRPEPGYSVPTAMRAATTAFAKAMAVEVAALGIQVNVVAPNYLESEMYYPAAKFVGDPAGKEMIAKLVPTGRLGTQAEVGELITFFASSKSMFTTGQTIAFTGGWSM